MLTNGVDMNLPSDRLVIEMIKGSYAFMCSLLLKAYIYIMPLVFSHVTEAVECFNLFFRKKIADAVTDAISYLDKFEKGVKDCLEI